MSVRASARHKETMSTVDIEPRIVNVDSGTYQSTTDKIPHEVYAVLARSRRHERLQTILPHRLVVDELVHEVFECLVESLPLRRRIVWDALLSGRECPFLARVAVRIELHRHRAGLLELAAYGEQS